MTNAEVKEEEHHRESVSQAESKHFVQLEALLKQVKVVIANVQLAMI